MPCSAIRLPNPKDALRPSGLLAPLNGVYCSMVTPICAQSVWKSLKVQKWMSTALFCEWALQWLQNQTQVRNVMHSWKHHHCTWFIACDKLVEPFNLNPLFSTSEERLKMSTVNFSSSCNATQEHFPGIPVFHHTKLFDSMRVQWDDWWEEGPSKTCEALHGCHVFYPQAHVSE